MRPNATKHLYFVAFRARLSVSLKNAVTNLIQDSLLPVNILHQHNTEPPPCQGAARFLR